jgi:hypothetical protein
VKENACKNEKLKFEKWFTILKTEIIFFKIKEAFYGQTEKVLV